ncbi:MAG: hypothetical protein HRK26_00605 [Rickettsiaceae bacterium H1]|nr:hypothetical protein [Rickettsiaceae bacterium H1]
MLPLNTVLTIPVLPGAERGIIDGHKEIWLPFTRCFLDYLNNVNSPIAFILWGEQAQSFKKAYINNLIHGEFIGGHPSPIDRGENFFVRIILIR